MKIAKLDSFKSMSELKGKTITILDFEFNIDTQVFGIAYEEI